MLIGLFVILVMAFQVAVVLVSGSGAEREHFEGQVLESKNGMITKILVPRCAEFERFGCHVDQMVTCVYRPYQLSVSK